MLNNYNIGIDMTTNEIVLIMEQLNNIQLQLDETIKQMKHLHEEKELASFLIRELSEAQEQLRNNS